MFEDESMFAVRKECDLSNEALRKKLLQKELTLDAVMKEFKYEKTNAPKTPIFNYLGEIINNNGYEYYFKNYVHIDPRIKDREVVIEPLAVYIVGSVLGDYDKNDDILVWFEGMAQELLATSL